MLANDCFHEQEAPNIFLICFFPAINISINLSIDLSIIDLPIYPSIYQSKFLYLFLRRHLVHSSIFKQVLPDRLAGWSLATRPAGTSGSGPGQGGASATDSALVRSEATGPASRHSVSRSDMRAALRCSEKRFFSQTFFFFPPFLFWSTAMDSISILKTTQ